MMLHPSCQALSHLKIGFGINNYMNTITLLTTYPDIFQNNKYLRWYEKLIINALNRSIDPSVYYEKHHYVPKSIISNNNLVKLTAREHYIAHLLLTKCIATQYKKKMIYAVTAMKFKVMNNIKVNSKLYESLQRAANIQRSTRMKNRVVSVETKQKLRAVNLGKQASTETKEKMSHAHKGKTISSEHIEKIRQFHLGRKRSEETKEKLRAERATRNPIQCLHCGKHVLPGNYHRWHGNNCKFNDET